MSEPIGTVNEKDLVEVLKWIRGLRAYAVKHNLDAWAVRQGLLMALIMDARAAIQRGIKPVDLRRFDRAVRDDMHGWMDHSSPKILRDHVDKIRRQRRKGVARD